MVRAWNSFWSEKTEFKEEKFTEIFISHIDNALKCKKFELVVELSRIYVDNIEKRSIYLIGSKILPKVLKWNEILNNEEQLWLKEYRTDKRRSKKRSYFGNWNYFGKEFFQVIIKILIKENPSQLYDVFKKQIDKNLEKLNKAESKKEKDKYYKYIKKLFASFCPTFFNEVARLSNDYYGWEYDFPEEWKVSMANVDNIVSRIILHEFYQWSKNCMFRRYDNENSYKDLCINSIFPNIDVQLFEIFLRRISSGNIKETLEKNKIFI